TQKVEAGVTTNYVYDRTDELVSQNNGVGTAFVYDAFGNMTKKAESISNQTTFVYDTANRLTASPPVVGNSASFTCDALGRIHDRTVTGAGKDTYAYVGTSEVAYEIANSLGTTTESFIDQTGARDGIKVGAATAQWVTFDLHGSVAALENGSK